MECPECKEGMIGIEYWYTSPNRYDGISEWMCLPCDLRIGRWSGKRLAEGEEEKRFGGN